MCGCFSVGCWGSFPGSEVLVSTRARCTFNSILNICMCEHNSCFVVFNELGFMYVQFIRVSINSFQFF